MNAKSGFNFSSFAFLKERFLWHFNNDLIGDRFFSLIGNLVFFWMAFTKLCVRIYTVLFSLSLFLLYKCLCVPPVTHCGFVCHGKRNTDRLALQQIWPRLLQGGRKRGRRGRLILAAYLVLLSMSLLCSILIHVWAGSSSSVCVCFQCVSLQPNGNWILWSLLL